MRRLTIGGLIAVITMMMVLGGANLAPTLEVAEANAGTQWNASYYNNTALSGSAVLQRVDDQINFSWGAGSPGGGVNADGFSARWTKTVNFPTTGSWTFTVGADDGVRMWIDVTPIVDEWHGNAEGYRTYTVTLDALTAGNHDLKVEYYEESGDARVSVAWQQGSGSTSSTSTETGSASWSANYFNNTDLSGSAVVSRTDTDLSFNWATGSPDGSINADNFSARWVATVNFPTPGHWRFRAGADDGVRMWVDSTLIIDEWHGNSEGYRNYEVDLYALTAGDHTLKVEYYEASGNAGVQVRWGYAGGDGSVTTSSGDHAYVAADPPATVYGGVTAENVNVRTGPGLGNPVMTQVFYPDNYRILGGVPDLSWLLIDLKNGTQGWVSNEWLYLFALEDDENVDSTGGGQPDFVDDIPRIDIEIAPPAYPPSVEEQPLRVILTGQAIDTLKLRDGPTAYASKVIGSVPLGSTFVVEAHNGNGAWYLIEYQGIRGWVSGLYVTLVDGYVNDLVISSEVVAAPPVGSVFVPQDATGAPVTVRGQVISNLKLRNAASVAGGEIGEIAAGVELVIEGRNTTGAWYLVTYQGVQGWIYSPYVALIEGQVADLQIK